MTNTGFRRLLSVKSNILNRLLFLLVLVFCSCNKETSKKITLIENDSDNTPNIQYQTPDFAANDTANIPETIGDNFMEKSSGLTDDVVLLRDDGKADRDDETPYKPVMRGYITNFNAESRTFDFDEIEWITLQDEDRIKELGIENDMPGGFYIYNPDESVRALNLAENAEFYVITGADHTAVNLAEFVDSFHDYAPYIIDITDGKVVKMTEQYLP